MLDRSKEVKRVNKPIEDGIVPDKPVPEKDKEYNDCGNPGITLAMAVFNLVLVRLICVRLVNKANSVGKLPVKEQVLKSRYTSFFNFATNLGNLENLEPDIYKEVNGVISPR